jgi:hypothetical protein
MNNFHCYNSNMEKPVNIIPFFLGAGIPVGLLSHFPGTFLFESSMIFIICWTLCELTS